MKLPEPDVPLGAAIVNWRRAQLEAEPEPTGYRTTCGSAERLYAGHAERDHRRDDEVVFPVDARSASRFGALVQELPADERLAWDIQMGLTERPANKDNAWIEHHYTSARTRLSAGWTRCPR